MSTSVRNKAIGIGCLVATGLFLGILIYRHGWLIAAVLAVGILIALAIDAGGRLWTRTLISRFHRAHPGKDLLIVYTESAAWQERIEQLWLPLWADRLIALNRSRPWSSTQLEAKLWRRFASHKEHTPMAIHLPRHGDSSVVLFYAAFREWQHGRPTSLLEAEAELAALLGTAPPTSAT